MRRLFLSTIVVLAAGCNGSTPTEPLAVVGTAQPRAGLVAQSGRVLDYLTDAPMPGARVAFRTFDGPHEHVAVADVEGVYRVELPPETYYISIDGRSAAAILVATPSSRRHLYAGAEGCSAIYGFVGDARTGDPLEGARVSSVGRTVTTDAEGWFRLDFGCDGTGGIGGTTVATFVKDGYERAVQVIGRGTPPGARRMDIGLLRGPRTTRQ